MKFKNKDKNTLTMYMSDKETKKYQGFEKETEVFDGGMTRTLADGEYKVVINDVPVLVTVKLMENDGEYIVEGNMNSVPYKIVKPREIRKYDIIRNIVNVFPDLMNNVKTM